MTDEGGKETKTHWCLCVFIQTWLTNDRVYFFVYKTVCHLVFRTVGPLLVLTILNCCLAQSLRDVRRRRQRIAGSAYCKVPAAANAATAKAGRGRQRENITAMVVAVICVFIVCELPDVALRLAVTVAQLLVGSAHFCSLNSKRKQFPRSILVTSSPSRPVSGVSGDLPVHLAARLPDWSIGGLLRCIVLSLVRVSCRSPNTTNPTRTTCCGHPREDVTRMIRGNCFRGI